MLKVSENFCLCKHHDTCIYHIFKCYIDKNNGRCRTKDYKSLCGTKQFSRGRFYCNDYICKTIEEMRNICTRLANNGQKICGTCVATLYHID
jgi:hypothetical protein